MPQAIDLWNSAVTFPSTGLRPKRFMKSTFDSWTIQGNRLALKPRPAAFRESAKALVTTGLACSRTTFAFWKNAFQLPAP